MNVLAQYRLFSDFDRQIWESSQNQLSSATIANTMDQEACERANAEITGRKLEEYFLEWCRTDKREWGERVYKTDESPLLPTDASIAVSASR